ncbi:anti-anti-sigma factor [Williamsia sterculiae]|uniref:Anti-anti-sigma factor n=1 Tax=Williamsia sterculiae TaxID=1344003 RepID=A0A1N7FXF8_9NOCA|nr:anti-anti-sigma factor [Williamsia sterculiae]
MPGTSWDDLVGDPYDVRWVFETMPVMLAALRGPDHRLIALNDAYRQLIPKADATGKPVREAFPEVLGQFVFDAFDHVYHTGETHHGKEWRIAIDLDGSGTTQDVYWDFTFSARRDDDGAIDGVDLVLQDVTARVRARLAAEQQLAEVSQRYEQVRSSATVMQQALLAPSVPVLPGVDIAAEYLVATEDTAAGGDWFDAIATDNGAVILVVGDVVGHGIAATAVMSQLRTATRLELIRGSGISDALTAVEEFAQHIPGAEFATLCITHLNTITGALEYATAGHPPPLLISKHSPRFLEPTGATPLGRGQRFTTRTDALGHGDAVLLYTDGVVERPGRRLPESTTEFATVATRVLAGEAIPDDTARPIDRLCSQTLELLLRNSGYSDDVTLLGAQRTTVAPPFHEQVHADAPAARSVRTRLREWLAAVGADHTDIMVVDHAVSEYVQNAIDHAYGPTGGPLEVAAVLDNRGVLDVQVIDHGQWVANEHSSEPSRGLGFVSALITTATVTPGDSGTRASFTYPLSRSARIVTDPAVIHTPPHQLDPVQFHIDFDDDGELVVCGDVDALHAPTLAGRIIGQSRSGTRALRVDLSAVTYLGSAGLRMLAEARAQARRQDSDLILIAPPGSTAHHVLSLVGIPTTPPD